MKNTVPEAFKDYCRDNEDSFTEEISFDMDATLYQILIEEAGKNEISLSCYVNYILKNKIVQIKAEQEGFSLGLIMYDIQLYDEDEFFELIETHKQILIFDEHLEKKGVILSVEEYNKYKEIEASIS